MRYRTSNSYHSKAQADGCLPWTGHKYQKDRYRSEMKKDQLGATQVMNGMTFDPPLQVVDNQLRDDLREIKDIVGHRLIMDRMRSDIATIL